MVDSGFSADGFNCSAEAIFHERRNSILACINLAICPTYPALAFGRGICCRDNQGSSSSSGNPNLGGRKCLEI